MSRKRNTHKAICRNNIEDNKNRYKSMKNIAKRIQNQ